MNSHSEVSGVRPLSYEFLGYTVQPVTHYMIPLLIFKHKTPKLSLSHYCMLTEERKNSNQLFGLFIANKNLNLFNICLLTLWTDS